MAATLKFELVSPEELLSSGQVRQVVVPGTEGDFAVLPGHAPVMSTIRPGVLDITDADGKENRIFVRGGFAEVNPEGLTVLAETAIAMADLSAERLAEQIKNAEDDVADAADTGTKARAQELLDHLLQLKSAL